MPEILVKFDEPIRDQAGAHYFAQAAGRKREDGLWEGWLEFIGMTEGTASFHSGRETTQPNRADIEYWAQGLSKVYLEGALDRAKSSTEASQRDGVERENSPDAW
jgi:hypothetical protein